MGRPRPDGLDAAWVRKALVRLSQSIAWLYRRSDGKLGKLWLRGAPVCLLDTTGRRTGKQRTAPLVYARDGDRVLIVACHGGLPHTPQWFLNLQAEPACFVQIGGARWPTTARIARPEERARLWPILTGVFPDFADYQAWAGHELPVVVLEPR